MNATEIRVIKETWQPVFQDPKASGQEILITFFTKYPHNLQKFKAFRDCPVNQLKDNSRFQAHASNIIYLLNDTIRALSQEDQKTLEEIWIKVAKSHFRRQISKESYNELKGVIIETLTALCKLNEEQQYAWIKFVDTLYAILFETTEELSKIPKN